MNLHSVSPKVANFLYLSSSLPNMNRYFSPRERKESAAVRAGKSLDRLSDRVDMADPLNIRYIRHKRALLHAQLASYYSQPSVRGWDMSKDVSE